MDVTTLENGNRSCGPYVVDAQNALVKSDHINQHVAGGPDVSYNWGRTLAEGGSFNALTADEYAAVVALNAAPEAWTGPDANGLYHWIAAPVTDDAPPVLLPLVATEITPLPTEAPPAPVVTAGPVASLGPIAHTLNESHPQGVAIEIAATTRHNAFTAIGHSLEAAEERAIAWCKKEREEFTAWLRNK